MKKKFKYLAMLYIMFLILPFGYGIWVISKSASHDGIYRYGKTNSVPVAYIEGEQSKQYTSIEKALKVAKVKQEKTKEEQTVYVIPPAQAITKTVMITKDATIGSGVTLVLPYEGEESGREGTADYEKRVTAGFSDQNSFAKRRIQVKIIEGIELTINHGGTLVVGGQLGESGSGLVGNTAGLYTEILLGKKSKIINNGTLDLYGYIKEDYTEANYQVSDTHGSEVYNGETGVMSTPFVIYDFKGGSYTYSAYRANVMPFSVFDFPNTQSLLTFEAGAELYGRVRMAISDILQIAKGDLIGGANSAALFKIENGTVSFKYSPSNNNGYTTDDAKTTASLSSLNKTKFIANGTISVSYVVIELELTVNVPVFGEQTINIDLKTSDYFLPLSYKMNFDIKSESIVNVPNKLKFITGSMMNIEENGTVNVGADVIFYQSFEEQYTNKYYPIALKEVSAELTNNGNLNLNAPFGGVIKTTKQGAKINIYSKFKNGVTSKEVKSFETLKTAETFNINFSAKGKVSENPNDNPENVPLINFEYKSKQFKTSQGKVGLTCNVVLTTAYAGNYVSTGLWWHDTNSYVLGTKTKTEYHTTSKSCDDFWNGFEWFPG